MKKLSLAFITAIAASSFAYATAPSGYYSVLNGKSGQALKDAVHNVVRPHTQLEYNSLWNYFPQTDVYPELVDGKKRVWDMYSDEIYTYSPGGTSGMNREHSFPKSWWGGTVNEAYTDINHLYPADGPANLAKNNYPLGIVDGTPKFDNGVTKVGYPKTGQGGGCNYVFEPDDRYKGDFARTYFYMATCYQDYTWKYTYMVSNGSYLTLNKWAYEMLLEWSRQDPVDAKEIDRNDAVFRAQNNRNPFIDNPGLEEYIWGNKMGQSYTVSDSPTSGDPELITPTQGTELDFGEVALGKSAVLDLFVNGQNLSNSLTVTLYSGNSEMFSVPVESISRGNANNGYQLRITYKPTNVGEHTSKVVFSDGGIDGSVGVILKGKCVDVPSLSSVKALAAQNITDNGFTANWEVTSDNVDGYNIELKAYDGTELKSEELISVSSDDIDVDNGIASFDVTDLNMSYSYTYRVQSVRLGYTSVWSNAITIDQSGVDGVNADSEMFAVVGLEDGALIKCAGTVHNVCVYNAQGQLLYEFPAVDNNTLLPLPSGVFVVTAEGNTHKAKVVIL